MAVDRTGRKKRSGRRCTKRPSLSGSSVGSMGSGELPPDDCWYLVSQLTPACLRLGPLSIDTCNIYSKNLDFPDAPVLDPSATYQRSDTLWTNGPRLMEFLKEMNKETFSKYDAVAIGEWPNTPDITKVLEVVSAEAKVVDMVFQFDHVCMDFGKVYRFWPREWKLSEFKGYIDQYQKVVDKTDGWQTTYL
jgi:glycosidase